MFEDKCPRCGKNFITAPFHIYKDKKGFYCSWTCFNHRNEVSKRGDKKSKIVEMCDQNGNIIAMYNSAAEASKRLRYPPNSIRVACRNNKTYKGYLWRYKNDLP